MAYPGSVGSLLQVEASGTTGATVSIEAARAGATGRLDLSHRITGLSSKLWNVRVAAFNAVKGTGECTLPNPAALTPAVMPPLAPTAVSVSVASSTSADVALSFPVSSGGAPVTHFVVEVDEIDSFN
jgi:hypothetical protein